MPVDVLIPTCGRPAALALTLGTLAAQTADMRIVISDQTEAASSFDHPVVRAAIRFLEAQGHAIEACRHLPRRGLAEQRHFLLGKARAPYVLFVDDDVLMETDLVVRLMEAIAAQACGFIGSALIGLSHIEDVRPHEQAIEFWNGRVQPELVLPGSPAWGRHRLHNAANLWHVQHTLGVGEQRLYKVAWVGGCVMFDREKLLDAGGFDFWDELPSRHCGEDVLAQLRVMARWGGCGILPSGAYHQELPTTVPDRSVDAPQVLRARITADIAP